VHGRGQPMAWNGWGSTRPSGTPHQARPPGEAPMPPADSQEDDHVTMSHGRITALYSPTGTTPKTSRRSTPPCTCASHGTIFSTCPSIQPCLMLQAQPTWLLFGARGVSCAPREKGAFSPGKPNGFMAPEPACYRSGRAEDLDQICRTPLASRTPPIPPVPTSARMRPIICIFTSRGRGRATASMPMTAVRDGSRSGVSVP
jgi:hypothetical protein